MIVFPNCKINLGLRILRKRADGYHDLDTVFYPLPLQDAVEIISNGNTQDLKSSISFFSSGASIAIPTEENICVKAYRLLKKDFPQLPPVTMHLHKIIPAGAGLGGGSADGAFTLKLLNEKFNLNLDTKQLIQYAMQLGSDCPFFILNQPCVASGRGEIMEAIKLDLAHYKFILVNPGIHISTAWAFSQIAPALPVKTLKKIIQQPIETWKNELINDFEIPVFKNYPEIKEIKNNLYKAGAVYAALSGSGSSVFGMFKKETKLSINFPGHYFIKELNSQP